MEILVLPNDATIGEIYGPAMLVQTREEAQLYFIACVQRFLRMNPDASIEEAERVERINIGYYSGYYDLDVMRHVEQMYGFGHPFLSPDMTPEEMMAAGARKASWPSFPDVRALAPVSPSRVRAFRLEE